ncbi:MAG TPA: hypothetical protein VFI02_13565 [Armatimonadota bacterium]|nr:hypothetical protein [Armatimonadota bacterium]
MTDERFSDRLVESEQMSPGCRERYEREVKAMLETRLTPIQRFTFGFTALVGIGFLVVFGYLAIMASELPALARGGFALGSIFGLVWGIVAGRVAWKGVMHRRNIPNALTGMVWGLIVFVTVGTLLVTGKHPDSVRSVYMVLSVLVYFVMGVAFVITNRIDQTFIRTEEKFLQLELKLAEIAERIGESKQ